MVRDTGAGGDVHGDEHTRLGSRQLTIAVMFTPAGGTARRESKEVTVKRGRKGKYS